MGGNYRHEEQLTAMYSKRHNLPSEQDGTGDLDRRESALNARVAQFENIVRKTKLSTAERLESIASDEARLAAKWDEIQEALDALAAREEDVRRREERVEEQLAKLSEREETFRRNSETFQARSDQILRQIGQQREELRDLIRNISK